MGADARLFAPQRDVFPNLEVPDWIQPRIRESLSQYAARWAETIDPDPPLFLGGVSFGGMVALEAARYLRPEALFLISSCRSGRVIPRRFLIFERMSRFLPNWSVGRLRGPLGACFARLERLGPEHTRLLRDLSVDASVTFIRWAASAVAGWAFQCEAADSGFPIHQVHGQKDRIVPPVPGEADYVIPGGGHLINLTHADEVNRFILDRL